MNARTTTQRQTEEELRRGLADAHGDLQHALQELERRARSQVDLGAMVGRHAPVAVGVAFAVGLWMGLRR